MRTDSVNLSKEAMAAAQAEITNLLRKRIFET
jgi:DNA topoisomerase IA